MVRSSEAATRNPLRDFIHGESIAGFILVLAAVMALVAANIPALALVYEGFLTTHLTFALGEAALSKPLLMWINEGLMALFFFLVGMEIKREILEGQLSSHDRVILPAVAALGGIVVPAAIYCIVNWGHSDLLRGWAIPTATDIAFALGVLSLLGSRVPTSIKIFLLTVATIDDLGAIAIIAVFYTQDLSLLAIIGSLSMLVIAIGMNRLRVQPLAPYVLAGLFMWLFLLESGIHATLAGVALAIAIPLRRNTGEPLSEQVIAALHPYVTFLILPIFAFANAGVSLEGFSVASLADPLLLGIVAGLLFGKPLGIMGAVVITVGLGFARLPLETRWLHIMGVSILAGIGFTMSLFIGSLAFVDYQNLITVRIGVLATSVIAAFTGFIIMRQASREQVS